MRGPKLSLVVAALAASACGRAASLGESPPPVPHSVEAAQASRTEEPATPLPDGAAVEALDALPWEERIATERTLAEHDPRYAPRLDETGPVLGTPGSVVATFGASGAALSFGAHETTMRVAAMGRGAALRPIARTSRPEVAGAEVRTTLAAGVVEWWRSLPSGLEHGVTFTERPAGGGELVVEVAVTGALSAHLISDEAVELRDSSGTRVATYAHLVVLDIGGARVPARLAVAGARIRVVVNDADARYPLVVDPLVVTPEAILDASGGADEDAFGFSVALSGDGSRALVAGPGDDTGGGTDAGSVRVFFRTGTSWVEEATLRASRGAMNGFGNSAALSSDGTRALVGVPGDATAAGLSAGSARVFLRTGTSWIEEATLLASGAAAGDTFGQSVALSADASRALVGTPSAGAPSARVFLRTGTSWVEEATLSAAGGLPLDRFGWSVGLDAAGSRAVVGASRDDTADGTDAGSARVFVRLGATWTLEATLVATGLTAGNGFGVSASLSSDGSRALVGSEFGEAARMFARTGSSWTEEATLRASGGASGQFGLSVALSSSGSRALVGMPRDDGPGRMPSARVFSATATGWFEEATLVAPDLVAFPDFGYSVALSADGSRALVGAPEAYIGHIGSARVFSIASLALGEACAADAACLSEFCVDGFCCDTACGGGATSDCEACSGALTGRASGMCAPLSPSVASTVTCRAAADLCDTAEVCVSTSRACPADALAPNTIVCRALAGACDAAPETCTGTSAVCPTDLPAASGTICRPESGPCDSAEACDGVSPTCPGDIFEPMGNVCGLGMGDCAAAATCTGSSAACPVTGVDPAGTPCRVAAGPCDLADMCDGTSALCVDRFAPDTTLCGTAPMDVCDAADHCAGTSAACVAAFLSGVECRASGGVCDIREVCSGTSASCPPDTRLSAGVSCRASTDTRCDPEEMCDGFATACPADVTTCGPIDAGAADGGGAADSGASIDAPTSGADAGAPPVAATGCGCRASAHATPFGALLGLLLGVAVLRRSRRELAHRAV